MAKTIKAWEASRIATRVAEKAHEHILVPLREALTTAAREAYDAQMAALGVTPAIVAALQVVLGHSSQCAATTVYFGADRGRDRDDDNYTAALSSGDGKQEFLTRSFYIQDAGLAAGLREMADKMMPALDNVRLMAHEVREQIEGRSVAQVVKAWPEIQGFVYEELQITNAGGPIAPIPFQSLLNKYLTALPAPAPAPALVTRAPRPAAGAAPARRAARRKAG